MYCWPCFVLLVLLVVTAKIPFEDQVIVASTKQRMQADKVIRHACFVLCLLLVLALPSGFLNNMYTLSTKLFIDIYELESYIFLFASKGQSN